LESRLVIGRAVVVAATFAEARTTCRSVVVEPGVRCHSRTYDVEPDVTPASPGRVVVRDGAHPVLCPKVAGTASR
jgi:hypothetical protein